MSEDEDGASSTESPDEKSAAPDFGAMAKRLASMGAHLDPVVNGLAEARKRSEQQRLELAKRLSAPPPPPVSGVAVPLPLEVPRINFDDIEHPSLETNRQIRALRTEIEAVRDHLGSVAEHQQKQVELVDALLAAFTAAAATAHSAAGESKGIALESKRTAEAGVKIARRALWAALALGAAQIIVAGLALLGGSPEPKPAIVVTPAPPTPPVAPAATMKRAAPTSRMAAPSPASHAKSSEAALKPPGKGSR